MASTGKKKKSTTRTVGKATSAGRRRKTGEKDRSADKPAAEMPQSAAAPAEKSAEQQAARAENVVKLAAENTQPAPAAADGRVKRPDLLEVISNRVELKRSDVKQVFDAMLDEMGKALDGNEELVLPPLGKLMVKKRDEKPGGQMLTLKLKRVEADASSAKKPPLAEGGEDS